MKRLKKVLDLIFSVKCTDAIKLLHEQPFDKSVHFPAIYALLHYGQLNHAEECFVQVPNSIKDDEDYQQLNDFYQALRVAEDERSVFPLNVSWRVWWDGPHLNFPEKHLGLSLSKWYPARIEFIEDGVVYLVVGEVKDGKTHYGQFEFSFDELKTKCPELTEQTRFDSAQFLELGFYGEEFLVRRHKGGKWDNEYLDKWMEIIKPWIVKRQRQLKEFAESFYKK